MTNLLSTILRCLKVIIAFTLLAGCGAPAAIVDDAGQTHRADAGAPGNDAGAAFDAGNSASAHVAKLSGNVAMTIPCSDGRSLSEGGPMPTVRTFCQTPDSKVTLQLACGAGNPPMIGEYTNQFQMPPTVVQCAVTVLKYAPSSETIEHGWSSGVMVPNSIQVAITQVLPVVPDAGYYDIRGSASGLLGLISNGGNTPYGPDAGTVTFELTF